MSQKLSNLPLGAKIKFGKHSVNGETALPIIWMVVAKNHSSIPAYPTNAITLITEKIIDLRAIDAAEPSNTDTYIQAYGNNRYAVSNIDLWLNEDKVSWYVARHSADHKPNNSYIQYETGYDTRPGFLSNFTSEEKNAILDTSIRCLIPTDTTEDITRKVFLPSITEVGLTSHNNLADGARWEYFESNESRRTTLTWQCLENTLSYSKPSSSLTHWSYWVRSSFYGSTPNSTYTVDANGERHFVMSNSGGTGVRPAINLSSTFSISDTMDSDGCYTVQWNTAPYAPTTITPPTNIYGGKPNTITWDKAVDPDENAITYQLECSVNGGEYAQIYKGASTSYSHLVEFNTSSVQYRVKAIDIHNESSEYVTSASLVVINNHAPVIDGTDGNLGVKDKGFTGTYTVTDANNNEVTVTEYIDGVQIRSLIATLGSPITYGVTGGTWLALPNGSHTLTIRATDGIDTSERKYTFTKLVNSFTISNSRPWATATMPTRIMLVVTRNIPTGATFKVEVCRNGYANDTDKVWEDATPAILSGRVHAFTKAVDATQWGIIVKVTVDRNGATGACYVSAIGGNFE